MNTGLLGTWRVTDWITSDELSFMHIKRDKIFDLVFYDNAAAKEFFGISVLCIDDSSDYSLLASRDTSYSFELLTRQLSHDEFMFYRMDGIPCPRKYFATRIELRDLPESMMKHLVAHRHYPEILAA